MFKLALVGLLLVGFALVSAAGMAHTSWSNLETVWQDWNPALQWAAVLTVWVVWAMAAVIPTAAVAGYRPLRRG